MLSENIRLALRSLAANKLRAALTMLGIAIGVAAVITLLSVGQGVSRYVAGQFEGLGTNLVFVFAGQFTPGGGPPGRRVGAAVLTLGDAQALADPARVPDALRVVPLMRHSVIVEAGNDNTTTNLRGVSPEYAAARNYTIAAGRFLTREDMDNRARVAVIGQTTLNHLFPPDEDPLGQMVRINGDPFRIIGILGKKGATPFGDEDDTLIVPFTTAATRLFVARTARGEVVVSAVMVQAADAKRQDALITEITDVLRDRHNIPYRGEDDFSVLSEEDLASAFGQVTSVLTIFLGAIAGIALLVGGIGIMNIMLVSITERTREIGLRKAVGAKRRHVLAQFLIESIVLALLGGAGGIALGVVGAWAVHQAVPQLDTSVAAGSIVLATGFSAAVGLFFGIYPAARASALSPMEALRYE